MSVHPIFFQADSRLLGSSPAGDLGMFGAQPTMAISFSPVGGGSDGVATHDPAVGGAAAAPEPVTAAGDAGFANATGSGDTTANAATLAPTQPAAPASLVLESAAPTLYTALAPVLPSAPAAPLSGEPGPVMSAPAIAEPGAAPDAAQPALAAVSNANFDSVVLAPAAGPVAGLTGLVGGVDHLVSGAIDALPLGELLALPGAAIGAIGETVEQLADGVEDTLGGVTATVDAVLDDLPVLDLLGTDPDGGIATLVNLVTLTDVLDLQDAGAPADAGGLLSPVENLLDTLTAEPLAPADTLDDHDGGQDGSGLLDDLPDLPILPALHPSPLHDLGLGHGG